MQKLLVLLALLALASCQVIKYPLVHYIDAVSGPVTGGENGLGSYLSIFGENFGTRAGMGSTTRVLIGGVEVANYRYFGPAKVSGALTNIQQITVQIGHLAGLTAGVAYPVTVVVNGVSGNTSASFTPNPGKIWFVSLSGNDATAVAGDITKPWRHLQLSDASSALAGVVTAGDHIIIRGGTWSDTAFESAWMRFRYTSQTGTAPTGQVGTGYIHITAYPGPVQGNAIEDVHYNTPAGASGGFQGANGDYFNQTANYMSISNLRFTMDANANADAAPINIQYSAGPWRSVNNEMGPWPSNPAIVAKSGGVSGANCRGCVVLGNYIHDISGSNQLENHGIYVDSGAVNWEIAYNYITRIPGGNGIQFYDSIGLAGNNYNNAPKHWLGFVGMNVHHNWLQECGKYLLNLADSSLNINVWNNVVVGAAFAGLRFNTVSANLNINVAFNTFYDNNRVEHNGQGLVENTWGDTSGKITISNNIIAAGPNTQEESSFYTDSSDGSRYITFRNNLYFDFGNGWAHNSIDPLAIYGNPMFVNKSLAGFDPELKAASPAIDKGTFAVPFAVSDDFTRVILRPQGVAKDIGAFERKSAN